jgi:hypothetical protein
MRRIAATASLVGLVAVFAMPVTGTAAGPQPPTCWAEMTNDGQAAQIALSAIGTNGQPGLSALNQGAVAAFVQNQQQSNCGF